MFFEKFTHQLTQKLEGPLPGEESHRKFMHAERLFSKVEPNNTTRNSAVLLVFYPNQFSVNVPLILRPAYDGTHGGQMALPGGKKEMSDENLVRTALREAQEEIGIKAMDVKVLGELTEIFIPVSNFLVKPIIGVLDYKPEFFPDKKEVERVFEINFLDFFDEKNKGIKEISIGQRKIEVPGYQIQNQWIWGATALILHEIIDLLSPTELFQK